MRLLKVVCVLVMVVAAISVRSVECASIFCIGNSLTWDTVPSSINDAEWHVFCSKNLEYIYRNPDHHCISSSRQWDEALVSDAYAFVTVQPFVGTTLEQDAAVISHWMSLQPNATFVLHTGWLGPDSHATAYLSADTSLMKPSKAYFDALEAALYTSTGRYVRRTLAAEMLYEIQGDIGSGASPFLALSDLYRDSIHMSYGDGQYLMNNVMRLAVDQELVLTPDHESSPTRRYLNAKLLSAVYVPEPSGELLVWIGFCGIAISRLLHWVMVSGTFRWHSSDALDVW